MAVRHLTSSTEGIEQADGALGFSGTHHLFSTLCEFDRREPYDPLSDKTTHYEDM